MRIDFRGQLVDGDEIRVGLIGCGSHARRNILPTFGFTPVELVATCDLNLEKAKAYASKFGGKRAYADYHEMVAKEKLDAVFVVVPFDGRGRPQYSAIAVDCLQAGVNVWIEKPPAATCADVEAMQQAARMSGKQVMTGFKRMFFQATEKAKALMSEPDFGEPTLVMLERSERLPTQEQFRRYLENGERISDVLHFLDHLCHPASTLVYLLGMPDRLFYERSSLGSGLITYCYEDGPLAGLTINFRDNIAGGAERIKIVGTGGCTVIAENNERVYYCRAPKLPEGQTYGNTPSYFTGPPESTTAYWEPEFTLGQLYNKGLFLLGYFGEINEFANAVLENRPVQRGTLEQAWQVTRMFEVMVEGPGRVIDLRRADHT